MKKCKFGAISCRASYAMTSYRRAEMEEKPSGTSALPIPQRTTVGSKRGNPIESDVRSVIAVRSIFHNYILLQLIAFHVRRLQNLRICISGEKLCRKEEDKLLKGNFSAVSATSTGVRLSLEYVGSITIQKRMFFCFLLVLSLLVVVYFI